MLNSSLLITSREIRLNICNASDVVKGDTSSRPL